LVINKSEENPNDVVPGPFLEKQLFAIQSALKEEIAEEQRKIMTLYTQLQEMNVDFKLELSNGSQNVAALAEECLEQEKIRDNLCEEIIRLRDECGQLRAILEQETMARNTSNDTSELQEGVVLVTKF
jgi:hypothetical protein